MRALTRSQDEVLEGLAHHRYLTTGQVRRLWFPASTEISGAANKVLRALESLKLVESTRTASRGETLWWPATEGYALLASRRQRAYRASRDKAEGQNQEHSIAVSEVGVLFVEAARVRGDECGPLSLEHEVRLSSGSAPVIADGLLSYAETHGGEFVAREALIEVDRARYPARRLWDRLRAYGSLKDDPRSWAVGFPGGWPPTLVVVDAPTNTQSELRIALVLDLLDRDPGNNLQVGFTTLPALRTRGPWEMIWSVPGDPQGRAWTLQDSRSAAGLAPDGSLGAY